MLPVCRTVGEGFAIPTFDVVPSDVETDGISLLQTTDMHRTIQTNSTHFCACHRPTTLPHWSA
jgi:hypothetical protein